MAADKHTWCVCITCGVDFTVPTIVLEGHRQRGGFHYCPSGHAQGWDKDGSEIERIRRERDRLKQDAARLEQEKAEAWATANAQADRARVAEAETKRVKKRATAALCPCCNRSFSQLERHMRTQHPEVTPFKAPDKRTKVRA